MLPVRPVRDPFPPRKPATPLKQKRYDVKAMTLCIAAQIWHQGKPAFVLCSDGRLCQGDWGASDSAKKTHLLGYNFVALMAGDWPTVREMCLALEEAIKGACAAPASRTALVETLDVALEKFSQGPLCKRAAESLITGFVNRHPLMLRVRVDDKQHSVELCQDYCAIGEAEYIASALLHYRGADVLNDDLAKCVYYIYEAKKFGEVLSSVGPNTNVKIHLHGVGDTDDAGRHCMAEVTLEGIARLERMRQELFARKVADDLPLPPLTEARSAPQSAKHDPQPQQPSQE